MNAPGMSPDESLVGETSHDERQGRGASNDPPEIAFQGRPGWAMPAASRFALAERKVGAYAIKSWLATFDPGRGRPT